MKNDFENLELTRIEEELLHALTCEASVLERVMKTIVITNSIELDKRNVIAGLKRLCPGRIL